MAEQNDPAIKDEYRLSDAATEFGFDLRFAFSLCFLVDTYCGQIIKTENTKAKIVVIAALFHKLSDETGDSIGADISFLKVFRLACLDFCKGPYEGVHEVGPLLKVIGALREAEILKGSTKKFLNDNHMLLDAVIRNIELAIMALPKSFATID